MSGREGEKGNDMDKLEWRAHFKALRAGIPADERARIDAGIGKQVLALPEFLACDVVLPYLSFGDEIETRDIMHEAWAAGKTVALPRCIVGTRTMRWYRVERLEGLVKSSFGVDEPAEDPASELNPADARAPLALVPGLAFDVQGFRMGYGGGFYDTFLKDFTGVSAGLCRECQMVEAVPALEPHDLAADIVVTESRVVRTA